MVFSLGTTVHVINDRLEINERAIKENNSLNEPGLHEHNKYLGYLYSLTSKLLLSSAFSCFSYKIEKIR